MISVGVRQIFAKIHKSYLLQSILWTKTMLNVISPFFYGVSKLRIRDAKIDDHLVEAATSKNLLMYFSSIFSNKIIKSCEKTIIVSINKIMQRNFFQMNLVHIASFWFAVCFCSKNVSICNDSMVKLFYPSLDSSLSYILIVLSNLIKSSFHDVCKLFAEKLSRGQTTSIATWSCKWDKVFRLSKFINFFNFKIFHNNFKKC